MIGPPYLDHVTVKLPNKEGFGDQLLSLFRQVGSRDGLLFEFHRSHADYHPRLFLKSESGVSEAGVEFTLSNGQTRTVSIENTTGLEKKSPHAYGYTTLKEVTSRLESAGLSISALDHLGFNLPWFEGGLHPQIAFLRSLLSPACLYHRFPTGEAWDFILPGTRDEIVSRNSIDYSLIRRPKFELVSFEKASKPLIQMEVLLPARYEKLAKLFPESLHDPHIRNVWVYLQNGFTIDVCLVLNPVSERDWSDYFEGCRL